LEQKGTDTREATGIPGRFKEQKEQNRCQFLGLLNCSIHFGLRQIQTEYQRPFQAPAVLASSENRQTEMGFLWLADLSIPFLGSRMNKKKRAV
jgi:hypothetical protein